MIILSCIHRIQGTYTKSFNLLSSNEPNLCPIIKFKFRWYFFTNHLHILVEIIHFFHKMNDFDEKSQIGGYLLTHFFWGGSQNQESPLKTNKQTIVFKFQISKSFPLWYPISHASMKKIHHRKHLKTKYFCFSCLIDLLYSIGLK